MLTRQFGPRTGQMITGIYRSIGIISNCRATEAETHSDTQRNRRKEGVRNESRKMYIVLTVRFRYGPKHQVSHLRFVSSSLLQFHFPPTSHSGHRNSSISFDPPLHYYFTVLKQFTFYHFLILAHLPFLCP